MNDSSERKAKIGSEHAPTMGRLGLEELRNALYPSSNVAEPNTMYGVYGTKTPGELADDRRSHETELNRDEEPQAGGYLAQKLEAAKDQSREVDRSKSRDMEMNRD